MLLVIPRFEAWTVLGLTKAPFRDNGGATGHGVHGLGGALLEPRRLWGWKLYPKP